MFRRDPERVARPHRAKHLSMALGLTLGLALSACSSSGESTGPTASTAVTGSTASTAVTGSEAPTGAALCQSVDDLQSSLGALTDVNIVNDGVDALTQPLDAVKSSLADIQQAADATFSSDVSAVQASVSDLEDIIQQAQDGATVQGVASDTATALASLSSAIQGLVTTAQDQNCDVS